MKKIELAKKSRKLFSAILAGAMLTTSVIPESFVWAADVEEVQGFGDSESMGFGSTPDPVTEDGEEGFTDEIASFGSNGSDTPVESGFQSLASAEELQERINALPTVEKFKNLADGTTVEGSTLNQAQTDVYAEAQDIAEKLELLSEDEQKIITSIAAHLERGEKRVGIQQVATENFVSTATIVKMCKRLGFEGYSELYYYLSRQLNGRDERRNAENLKNLIDNYSDTLIDDFCGLLKASRQEKMFTTGAGFSNIVGSYIAQRLSICGFMVFNNVHFYDYMLFQDAHHLPGGSEPSVMFAVSQSGETEPVLNDVRHAQQHGHKIMAFTKRGDSALARLADIVFVIDGSKQTLVGSLPNPFFGHVILAFEDLIAIYFDRDRRP